MFYAVEKELTLFQVQYTCNMLLQCDWIGFTRPETLLLGAKLAQILFDKYISFHNTYQQLSASSDACIFILVPSVDRLYNFTIKLIP